MWLFEIGSDIQKFVVPQHFGPRRIARQGFALTLDIDEGRRPVRALPRRLVEIAIDGDGAGRAVGHVVQGLYRLDIFHIELRLPRGGGKKQK